jgi:hypothetical protein
MTPYAETTRIRRLAAPPRPPFVPWHVPAWLPPAAEGPATFVVGVVAGLVVAFFVSTAAGFVTSLVRAAAPSPTTAPRAASAVEPGARALVITRPRAAALRAAAPLPGAVTAPAHPARRTAVAHPLPRREVLFAAALAP